jgi:transposase
MPKRREFTLSNEDLKVVEDTIAHDKRPEVVKRAMALRFLHLGHSTEDVAEMMLVGVSTIYTWWRRWEAEGVTGLANKPKSGRPSKATAEYCQKLDEALEQDPAAYGYTFTIWTLDRLRDHLEAETGIRLSRGRFQILMKKRDYVYRRPKRDLQSKQDADAKAQAAALIEELKKGQNLIISSSSLWTKRPSD